MPRLAPVIKTVLSAMFIWFYFIRPLELMVRYWCEFNTDAPLYWSESISRDTVGHLIPFFRIFVKRNYSGAYVSGRWRRRKLLHKVLQSLTCHLGVCSCGGRPKLSMRTHGGNQTVKPNRALGARRNAHSVLSNKGVHLLCSCVTTAERGTKKRCATSKYNDVLRAVLGS